MFICFFHQSLSNTASLHIDLLKPCGSCENVGENWLCLMCSVVFCSRYVKSHMVEHNSKEPSHMLALSFMDLSVWCYDCDSCKFILLLYPWKTTIISRMCVHTIARKGLEALTLHNCGSKPENCTHFKAMRVFCVAKETS